MYKLVEGKDFALKGGVPGYIYKDAKGKSQWFPINLETFPKAELDRLLKDYRRRRGDEQISRDLKILADLQRNSKPQPPAQPETPPNAPAAPSTPSQPTRPPTSSTTPSAPPTRPPATPQRPPTTPSVSDQIRSGLERYRQQVKSGDVKGAETTGRSTWALANPKLAAAAAERERTRGTAQSDNPLLDRMGLRSGMRTGSPTVQSPTLQKDLGNLSPSYTRLTQNPNAGITPAPRPVSTQPTSTQPSKSDITSAIQSAGTSAQNKIKSVTPSNFMSTTDLRSNQRTPNTDMQKIQSSGTAAQNALRNIRTLRAHYEYEPYDIVLEYLMSKGHAEDLNEANYIMLEMDDSSITNILEEYQNYLLAEEISEWVDVLVEQGHDLSDYTWDEIVEYYVNETK